MASPGPRARQHIWQEIPVPKGEDVGPTYGACACGAQRRTSRGPSLGIQHAYRLAGTTRWQARAPGCGRPIEIYVKKPAPAGAGGTP